MFTEFNIVSHCHQTERLMAASVVKIGTPNGRAIFHILPINDFIHIIDIHCFKISVWQHKKAAWNTNLVFQAALSMRSV